MKKEKGKENVIQHKKRAIRKLNSLLEQYISSEQTTDLKKADLLSYWIEDFAQYISQEDEFEPSRLLRYNRGDVIRVNFGFRVGSEIGGLHFAVVIDNHNAHNASVITVIPLSSTDGRDVHKENVNLGMELYIKASERQKFLSQQATDELNQINTVIQVLRNSGVDLEHPAEKDQAAIRSFIEKRSHLDDLVRIINRNTAELQKMKSGSMAVMNQITTVSKQRIYVPKKASDFLYKVSLSESAMSKINDKLIERIVHSD